MSNVLLPLYLPPDPSSDAVATAVEHSELLALWSSELQDLLRAPHAEFWQTVVQKDGPVLPFLDSYLRFAPRQLVLESPTGAQASTPQEAEVRAPLPP